MKIKTIFLIVLVLFITGCTANYNLDIGDAGFKESINFYLPKSNFNYDMVNSFYKNKTPISLEQGEDSFYDVSIKEDSNNYFLSYSYNHDINNFRKSYFINNCYNSFNVIEKGNIIDISTSKYFSCVYKDDGAGVDSLTINITTDYDVVSNNADEVVDNTYKWKIDKTNYMNKPINIKLDKSGNNSSEFLTNLTIISLIIFIIVIILFILKKKHKKNNLIK